MILKKILLFILIFLGILFFKNSVFGLTITYNNWEGSPQYATIEPLVLPAGTNSYITAINNDRNEILVAIPYNSGDYIANVFSGSSYRLRGYTASTNTLTDITVYKSTFSTDTASWSSWTSSTSSYITNIAPDNTNYIYKSKYNVVQYCNGIGVIGTEIISSGVPLPEGIKLTDNIVIFSSNNVYYLGYTPNMANHFRDLTSCYCISASGSQINFDYYTYNSSTRSFDFVANARNCGSLKGCTLLYSSNDFLTRDDPYARCR